MSKDYDILLSKFNICMTERQDLREQLKKKNEQWQQRDKEFEITKKLTRELCEMILAKDQSQMTLGKQKSWANIQINELINMAKIVFREYNNRRNDDMQRIADELEGLERTLADLRNEYYFYKLKNSPQDDQQKMTSEEIQEAVKAEEEIEKKKAEKRKKAEETKDSSVASTLDPKVQSAFEQGKIKIEQIQKAETVKKGIQSGDAVGIIEEEDVTPIEGKMHEKNIRRNVEMNISKTTPTSIRAIRQPELQNEYRKKQQSIEDEYDKDRLKVLEKQILELGWLAVKVFGDTGCSRTSKLVSLLVDEGAKNGIVTTERTGYSTIRDLVRIGVFNQETVSTHQGQLRVLTFTRDGANLYREKYGEKPSIFSEADKLKREHGSLEHGYCILLCAESIKDTNIFKEVSIFNRKHPLKMDGSGLECIPDIICEDENGRKLMIEYELDHYEQRDFNGKTKKILMFSDTANWITSNQKIAESLLEKTKKLIQESGDTYILRDKVIRITTVANIKGLDIRKDQNWKYVFYPSKGEQPVVNF